MKASTERLEQYYPIELNHLPDEHLRGIGIVAVAWSFLEGIIERIAWKACRLTDERGQAFTTHMSLPARLDTMCTAVEEEFPGSDIAEELPKIAKRIKQTMAPLRNEIVHSRIFKLEEFEDVFRKTYKARMRRAEKTKVAQVSEYEATAKTIINTTNELVELANELRTLIEKKDGTPAP